ncbi:MAG: hypothetical protein BWK79_18105 [Beggiatoa sp. IS2]|nr:MAG: hypothetical protein BWK79_18105 [Beggiatoa sp. IS2]
MINLKSQFTLEDTHTWRLSGELSFDTVSALLTDMTRQPITPQTLDLQAVTRTDSAGLALLIELRKRFNTLVFKNIPPQMLTLAKVSGVENLLI